VKQIVFSAMSLAMISWLKNPQASYVLVAYGTAVVALFALWVWSWRHYRRHQLVLRQLRGRTGERAEP